MSRPSVARRLLLVLTGVIAALAVLAPTALASGFTLHVKFPNHTPVAGKAWRITITATKGRQKLSGTIKYVFKTPVGNMTRNATVKVKNGVAHDSLKFPGDAVGHKLPMSVVVTTRYGTDTASWWVKPRK
jgi:uncharacterized protein (DUF58 family)